MVIRWVVFAVWMSLMVALSVLTPAPKVLAPAAAVMADGSDPMPLCRKCQKPPQ